MDYGSCDCGIDESDVWVILPKKGADGSLITIVCLACAKNSSAYCKKHERPHSGFADDDTTVCISCVNEMVYKNKVEELAILDKLTKTLSAESMDEFERLLSWAELSSKITGDTEATCVLRAIVAKALRLKTTIEEVIEQIIKTRSVESILPEYIFSLY